MFRVIAPRLGWLCRGERGCCYVHCQSCYLGFWGRYLASYTKEAGCWLGLAGSLLGFRGGYMEKIMALGMVFGCSKYKEMFNNSASLEVAWIRDCCSRPVVPQSRLLTLATARRPEYDHLSCSSSIKSIRTLKNTVQAQLPCRLDINTTGPRSPSFLSGQGPSPVTSTYYTYIINYTYPTTLLLSAAPSFYPPCHGPAFIHPTSSPLLQMETKTSP
jgi:hypothetical protein